MVNVFNTSFGNIVGDMLNEKLFFSLTWNEMSFERNFQ